MSGNFLNQVQAGRPYFGFSLILGSAVVLTAMTTSHLHQRMDELTVKRINIVEDDGTIRMVISNKALQHPGRMDGDDLPARKRPAGILFFNEEGDEVGGLGFGVEDFQGQKMSSVSLTMDQYKNDQVVQILTSELHAGDQVRAIRGFVVNQFPAGSRLTNTIRAVEEAQSLDDEEVKNQRLMEISRDMGSKPVTFLGQGNDGNGLFIYDNEGRPKLLIFVDTEGQPHIQVLDSDNNIRDVLKD